MMIDMVEGAREVPQQSLPDRLDDLENVHNDSPSWRSVHSLNREFNF